MTALAIFSSCNKQDNIFNHKENDSSFVIDNAMAKNKSNKVIEAVNTSAEENDIHSPKGIDGLDSILPPCATVTIDTSSSSKTITIDFGTTACLCSNWDGKYREGKI